MTEPAYENPLMPNAKLRQMYSGVLRLRMLSARISPQPKRSVAASPLGFEACLVAPTVDLTAEDLVADAFTGGTIDFLRGTSAEQVLNPSRRSRATGTLANSGAATRLSIPATGSERLWAAIGSAAALKQLAEKHLIATDGSSSGLQPAVTADSKKPGFSPGPLNQPGTRDGAVLVCYMRPEDAQPAAWTKALAYVSAQKLPLLFVVLPAAKARGSRTGHMASIAIRNRIPGMPVDQDDAVALYRVAQEAIGHARIGGGGALIECVRYTVEGAKSTPSDAITGLAQYMLPRGVADKRWMESEAKSFASRIGLQLAR